MLYDLISDATHAIIQRKGLLFRALSLPFLAYIMLEGLVSLDLPSIVQVALYIIQIYVGMVIAITTHRALLLGPESVPPFGIMRISRREAKYFLYFLVWCLMFIPLLVLSMAPAIGAVFLTLFFWLCGRLALVFPGVAIDDDISFRRSWILTAGHGFTMSVIIAVVPVLLAFTVRYVYSLPFGAPFGVAVSAAVTVFTIAVLSMAYRAFAATSGGLRYRRWSDTNP